MVTSRAATLQTLCISQGAAGATEESFSPNPRETPTTLCFCLGVVFPCASTSGPALGTKPVSPLHSGVPWGLWRNHSSCPPAATQIRAGVRSWLGRSDRGQRQSEEPAGCEQHWGRRRSQRQRGAVALGIKYKPRWAKLGEKWQISVRLIFLGLRHFNSC